MWEDAGIGMTEAPSTQEPPCPARVGEYTEPHGPVKLYVDDDMVAEQEIRTILSRYSRAEKGSASATTAATRSAPSTAAFDVTDDAYVDVERELAAAMARD
jgi:hypothetical protein